MFKLILSILLLCSITAVSAQKISIGEYEVTKDSTFKAQVIASNLSNISGIEVTLNFEPSVVNVLSYVGLKNCFNFDNIDNSKGFAKIIIICTDGINAERLEIINFTLKAGKGNQTPLKIFANLSTTDFKLITPEIENGYVKIIGEEKQTSEELKKVKVNKQQKVTTPKEVEEQNEVVTTPSASNQTELTQTEINKTSEQKSKEKLKTPGFETILALLTLCIAWRMRR